MTKEKNTFNVFLLFLFLHAMAWTLIPSLSNINFVWAGIYDYSFTLQEIQSLTGSNSNMFQICQIVGYPMYRCMTAKIVNKKRLVFQGVRHYMNYNFKARPIKSNIHKIQNLLH